ncbi:MAG: DUF6989 domain-containing protein [Promethearchaeota archaeon]|jgi:hypothetical protein
MKKYFSDTERDLLLVHLAFIVACFVIILIPMGIQIGVKLFILVVLYNLLLVIVGVLRDYKEWFYLWIFVFLISVFQIFPDWILSAELNVLIFPEDGLFKIGTVSGYMLGLWVIPLFIIIYIAKQLQERFSKKIAYISVILLSLAIFGISEQFMWMLQSWYAQNVLMIGRVALYIIIPEIILGLSTFYCYEWVKEKSHLYKIPVAFLVMIIYLGNAIFYYFIIERVVFP